MLNPSMKNYEKTPTEFLESINQEITKYLWSIEDKETALELLKIQYHIIEQKNKLNNKTLTSK